MSDGPRSRRNINVEQPTPLSPNKKISAQAAEGMIKRLSNAPKRHAGPIITDMDLWKRRHKLGPKDRVFIVVGGYGTFRKGMLHREWFENSERDSPCFDLKWTLKAKDIDYANLTDDQ
jgi:hypothetical protein